MVLVQVAAAKKGFDIASGTVQQLTGYDFVGLISRIMVFYVVALIIAKIMETIIFFSGGLNTAASLSGTQTPFSS